MNNNFNTKRLLAVPLLACVLQVNSFAQTITLENLSDFKTPSTNWQVVGGVKADYNAKESLKATAGKGIIANLPEDPKQAKDLYTTLEHGDADIEFEFMMAKESNSGIYLQGRYEVQLLDSWAKVNPTSGDLGGIYERADPKTEKGFEGYAPRINAARVPGVWQHMKISFQAPRFDNAGQKIANARILNIQLNGQTIHENIELTGPTRGPMSLTEAARGPLRIQGDHGPVAFRNLSITSFDSPKPTFTALSYEVHDGRVVNKEELKGFKAAATGKTATIDHAVTSIANNYVTRYTGKLKLAQSGKYTFQGIYNGGYGQLEVNGKTVIPFGWWQGEGSVELPAGEVPFTYTYSKVNEGDKPSLGLYVEGPGVRSTPLHENSSVRTSGGSNPIFLEVGKETVIHRSFIKFQGKTLPYGISVGTPTYLNYSLDASNGSLFRVWRGEFLDVTPMWDSRGNGTSFPRGSAVDLSNTAPILAVNGKTAENFTYKGYSVDKANNPTFRYEWDGVSFEDVISPEKDNRYLERTVKSSNGTFTFALATGSQIESSKKNEYLIDGRYYIQVIDGGTATIAEKDGKRTLTVTTKGQSLTYAVIW